MNYPRNIEVFRDGKPYDPDQELLQFLADKTGEEYVARNEYGVVVKRAKPRSAGAKAGA